jgi:hypothetical protein
MLATNCEQFKKKPFKKRERERRKKERKRSQEYMPVIPDSGLRQEDGKLQASLMRACLKNIKPEKKKV